MSDPYSGGVGRVWLGAHWARTGIVVEMYVDTAVLGRRTVMDAKRAFAFACARQTSPILRRGKALYLFG